MVLNHFGQLFSLFKADFHDCNDLLYLEYYLEINDFDSFER